MTFNNIRWQCIKLIIITNLFQISGSSMHVYTCDSDTIYQLFLIKPPSTLAPIHLPSWVQIFPQNMLEDVKFWETLEIPLITQVCGQWPTGIVPEHRSEQFNAISTLINRVYCIDWESRFTHRFFMSLP